MFAGDTTNTATVFCFLENDGVLRDCIFIGKLGGLCGDVQRRRYLNFNHSQ